MPFSLVALWKQDTALNTYIFGLFLIGLPFTLFGTYVIYQLQVVGYLIGTNIDGEPCLDYCLVPFGSQQLDLNSVLLYLNALGFGLGGVSALFISAYADFWSELPHRSPTKKMGTNDMHLEKKSSLVALLVIFYGAISIPVYWLRDTSLAAFNALMALYVIYAVITYIITVVFNMFIPHCMRTAGGDDLINASSSQQAFDDEAKTSNTNVNALEGGIKTSKSSKIRKYGFMMSIWGSISTAAGGVLALVVVIILSQTLPGEDGQSAGLLVTTVVGFITIAGSIVTYLGLPDIESKPKKDWKAWWVELATPLKDLLQRRNMTVLLLSYTIYTDTVFALNSIISQLYFAEIQPNTLEYSLYSMAFTIFGAVTTLAFYLWQIWRPPFSLENWLVIGYALILIIPIWGCIGLADNVNFGFKVTILS
jgi:MFS-type transporter involved in bile tolerance (Atg22 family)